MVKKPSRRISAEVAATPIEIRATIKALTTSDWARLRSYADNRIQKLGPKASGKEGQDLLQISFRSLLDDTRRWDPTKVDFVTFLIGVMRSISSNWARGYKLEESLALTLDDDRSNMDGEKYRPMDRVRDNSPSPEQRVIDKQKRQADSKLLEMVEELIQDDEPAQMVIEAWREGLNPAGARALWDLSQNDYNTIVRRIRRTVNRSDLAGGDKHGQ